MTTARELGFVTCTACAKVWPGGTPRCECCGHRLQSRHPNNLQVVWAFWLTGLLCYIPANMYPMLVTSTLVGTDSSTIIGGAVAIAQHGDLAIAAIVLIASVVIPVAKFIAIAHLALSVKRGSRQSEHGRQHLYEVVEFIGRWSMIDVFVVAILSALVQLSVVASIHPGPAALTFALSVVFTMLAARSFDTRLIWDSIGPESSET
ncbi:paraquat-inducible protein A [Tropicibacter oceani]|uniref:Paraquat-inducible protein A n=1 Tax=Tropicibacter oceani TaxID=3058420 RepID=A0ABY8QGK3_9RHOB|nr:paraquat-inducible protein A [Tropicibacter oceani]WGW03761.1 paraquat-inducible protein A [Tropicibacter oceani]